MRTASILALVVVAALAAGCPRVADEATVRAREAVEREARLRSVQVTLYRVAKTAVRSAPPRARVLALARSTGKDALSREDWAAMIGREPDLVGHKGRVGLFVAGCALREAVAEPTGAALATAIAATRASGETATASAAGPASVLTDAAARAVAFPGNPFPGGAREFLRECEDVLRDDEDRYPTLAEALVPEAHAAALRERKPPFAAPPLDRLGKPAFEHLVLAAGLLFAAPDLSLYEAERAKAEDLGALEAAALELIRARLALDHGWSYRALDELDRIAKRLPDVRRSVAGAVSEARADEVEATLDALVKLLRSRSYAALGREDDAAREFAAAKARLAGRTGLARTGHLIVAAGHLDRLELRPAIAEIRLAIEDPGLDPATAEELRRAIASLETLSPDAARMARTVEWLLGRDVVEAAIGPRGTSWTAAFEAKAKEQAAAWQQSFPDADGPGLRAAALLRSAREATAGTGSAASGPEKGR